MEHRVSRGVSFRLKERRNGKRVSVTIFLRIIQSFRTKDNSCFHRLESVNDFTVFTVFLISLIGEAIDHFDPFSVGCSAALESDNPKCK